MEKIQETDQKVQMTQKQKEEELMIKKEMENLKRKDRQETVERIARIQEYKRDKIMEKIVQDDVRSQDIRVQKTELLDARGEMRRQADR